MPDSLLEEISALEQRLASRAPIPIPADYRPDSAEIQFLDKAQTRRALLAWLKHQPRTRHRLAIAITSFSLTMVIGSAALISLVVVNTHFLVPMTDNLHQIARQADINEQRFTRSHTQRKQLEDRLNMLQLDQQQGLAQLPDSPIANSHLQHVIRLFEISGIFVQNASTTSQPDEQIPAITLHYLAFDAQLEFSQWQRLKRRITALHPALRVKSEKMVSVANEGAPPLIMLSASFMIPSAS